MAFAFLDPLFLLFSLPLSESCAWLGVILSKVGREGTAAALAALLSQRYGFPLRFGPRFSC